MQKKQIMEQYELFNLNGIEAAKNRKMLRKLDREILQLNASFTICFRETIVLIHDKNFILTMLQPIGKIAVL